MSRLGFAIAIVALSIASAACDAKVVTRTVKYEHEGAALEGYLAYDDARSGPRPGVLVVHEWWGLNDYTKSRARELAAMGYVAFAADMFGAGKVTRDPKQAQAWYGEATGKPGLLASRSKAGLDVLRGQPQVDKAHVAAIGFCFGGTTVLSLAYSGEPLDATVTFHGGLIAPDTEQAKRIRTTLLVLHGAEDTFVDPKDVDDLRKSLDAAKVDWYMVTYANAVHAFSNRDADSYKVPGIAYNEAAARRSWIEMQRLFQEKLARKSSRTTVGGDRAVTAAASSLDSR